MRFIFQTSCFTTFFKQRDCAGERKKGGTLFSSVCSGTIYGLQSSLIRVEVDLSRGLPNLVMVGSLGSEVRESGERVRVALKNSGMEIPPSHISVNLSPADIHKSGTGFDLPIALGVLVSMGRLSPEALADFFVLGELGLNGEIKGVNGVLPLVWEAYRQGKKCCMVPMENYGEAAIVEGIRVVGVSELKEACAYLNLPESQRMQRCKDDATEREMKKLSGTHAEDTQKPCDVQTHETKRSYELMQAQAYRKQSDDKQADASDRDAQDGEPDFSDVRGQESLKRGALIAAAGFHHMLIIGPPGSGKTMIAKRIPTILPELSFEESMEVTSIYSIAGRLPKGQSLIKKRPFLNPHHTVTVNALSGGGKIPQPGLVSLAHRGVLFMDELPEFKRQTIDLLRQPLEDKEIHIARSAGAFTYPADFMLIGAMNPCPCGFYPDRNKCKCTPFERHMYMSHLSGPIMDRMDLCLEARKVNIRRLQQSGKELSSAEMREMVQRARNVQEQRYRGTGIRFNADLTIKHCEEFCRLGKEEQDYAQKLAEKLELSARSYFHLLKVSRTIADLEGSEEIRIVHLAEAMSYRLGDPKEMGQML